MAESGRADKPLGFWACWSLTVGTMIGSGVFMLPAVLAPHGLLSFGGWLITGGGSILLALMLGRLAARTTRTGGPYVYAHDAFGDLTGFLVVWGYWISYCLAVPAIAIAFVGYLGVFVPAIAASALWQAAAALALIWALTLVNVRGVRESAAVQIAMTLLKIAPLLLIVALGFASGDPDNLPAFNPADAPLAPTLAATALLTMWAFSGLEAGVIPAGSVRDPKRTIPRAVVIGTVTVTVIYLAATAAVMLLVPAEQLARSTSPFADAARGFGHWGAGLIAAAALVATAGAMNGCIFISGQLPMAAARDGLAPSLFGRCNAGASPYVALLISSLIGSLLLLANYSRGLIGAFTFLLMMSTITVLAPLLVSALAELRHSWRSARVWALVALLAGGYSLFAIIGSGLEVIGWGVVLLVAGLPLYFVLRKRRLALS
ncbi:MAG TPA: amino acid permease [Vitreimonas sp.]|uniref:APC family permease n=1 Tax=Vitreimonas sp. TaxID=3069702 RepID=UPI002D2CE4DD|nr:amino acid permease [Vitreimonas sp.]HYD87231.1 amino acid permease [Vitreimonas sp.]